MRRSKGNILFIITVAGLILTAAASISATAFLTLSQCGRETEWHQIRLTAKSAANQALYRIMVQRHKAGARGQASLTGDEWEKIIAGSDDKRFRFDESADPGFSVENGCRAEITFSSEGKYRSIYNFSSEKPVRITGRRLSAPPNSVDLVIRAGGRTQSRTFEAVIEKRWPYCLASGAYAVDIGRGSVINGNVYSSGRMISKDVSTRTCYVHAGLSDGRYGAFPEINGNLTAYDDRRIRGRHMLDANVENSLDGAFKIDPGASFSGKRELTGLRISGYDISDFSEGFGNGSARRIDEELLASGAMEEISGTELGGFSKYLPEGNGKVYLLKKPLRLAGVGRGAGGSVPPDSNSYEIGGSVVSYPEITKGVAADIECDGCELAVDGAMLMISEERNANEATAGLHGRGLQSIPKLKGTDASICASGNICISGGMMESSMQRLVLYGNEDIFFRPCPAPGENKSTFKGAIACRKRLTIRQKDSGLNETGRDDVVLIKGAALCGFCDKTDEKNRQDSYEELGKNRIYVENAEIEYDPDNISPLHRSIGIPSMAIWREW